MARHGESKLKFMMKKLTLLFLLLAGFTNAATFPVFIGGTQDYITNAGPGSIMFVFSNKVVITVTRPNQYVTFASNVFMPRLSTNASPVSFIGKIAGGEIVETAAPVGTAFTPENAELWSFFIPNYLGVAGPLLDVGVQDGVGNVNIVRNQANDYVSLLAPEIQQIGGTDQGQQTKLNSAEGFWVQANIQAKSNLAVTGSTKHLGPVTNAGYTVHTGPVTNNGATVINSTVQVTTSPALGKVMTSDANGLVSLQFPAGGSTDMGGAYVEDDFQAYTNGATNIVLNGGYGWGTNDGRMDRGTNYIVLSTNIYNGQISSRLQIRNGGFTRKMPWGGDWMRLRLALLWRFPSNEISTNNFSGSFFFGLCNGTNGFPTNPPTAGLTNVPIWWGIGDSATVSIFEYKATAASFHTYLGGVSTQVRWQFLRVTNNSYGVTGPSGGSALSIARDAGNYSWVILNVGRSVVTNVALSSGIGVPNNSQIAFHRPNIAMAKIIMQGDVTGTRTGIPTGFDLTSGTDASIVVNPDLYGALDSINFAWTRPGTNAVEIAGYAVIKLQ